MNSSGFAVMSARVNCTASVSRWVTTSRPGPRRWRRAFTRRAPAPSTCRKVVGRPGTSGLPGGALGASHYPSILADKPHPPRAAGPETVLAAGAAAEASTRPVPICPWSALTRFLGRLTGAKCLILLARPKRFELLTPRFVVWCRARPSRARRPRRVARKARTSTRRSGPRIVGGPLTGLTGLHDGLRGQDRSRRGNFLTPAAVGA